MVRDITETGARCGDVACDYPRSYIAQVQAFVQRVFNKDINRNHAVAFARSDIPKLVDHFLHFQQVPALVEYLKGHDPNGLYEWDSENAGGVVRFRSLIIVCSWWIASGPHLREVLNIDGTGLETIIGGTLTAALTLSANDNIMPLGLLFTSCETADNVTPFMQHLRRLYPRQRFLVSDSGRAFEAAADRVGFECHGGCSWHVRDKNARTKVWHCVFCVLVAHG